MPQPGYNLLPRIKKCNYSSSVALFLYSQWAIESRHISQQRRRVCQVKLHVALIFVLHHVGLRLKTQRKITHKTPTNVVRNSIKFTVNVSLFVRKYCLKHHFVHEIRIYQIKGDVLKCQAK